MHRIFIYVGFFVGVVVMAMYHLSVKYVSRGQGRSSVGAAAYRAGEKLHNEYDGLTHDFTNKKGIVFKEIMLPENAPREFCDRSKLWNAAERAENRRDSRTALEIELALPCELSFDEQIKLVRAYVADNFVCNGRAADIAIHDGKHSHEKDPRHVEAQNDKMIAPDNPHAHVLLTERPVDQNGFSAKKDPQWKQRRNIYLWRESWANAQNREFIRKELEVRVTHESYEKRGLDLEPTVHQGHEVTELERQGVQTRIGNINRAIRARNLERQGRYQEAREGAGEMGADRPDRGEIIQTIKTVAGAVQVVSTAVGGLAKLAAPNVNKRQSNSPKEGAKPVAEEKGFGGGIFNSKDNPITNPASSHPEAHPFFAQRKIDEEQERSTQKSRERQAQIKEAHAQYIAKKYPGGAKPVAESKSSSSGGGGKSSAGKSKAAAPSPAAQGKAQTAPQSPAPTAKNQNFQQQRDTNQAKAREQRGQKQEFTQNIKTTFEKHEQKFEQGSKSFGGGGAAEAQLKNFTEQREKNQAKAREAKKQQQELSKSKGMDMDI